MPSPLGLVHRPLEAPARPPHPRRPQEPRRSVFGSEARRRACTFPRKAIPSGWVQFVSLETAEAVRTDFYEGEPFILARAPDPSDGFVYLAVPPELLPIVEELPPLEMIEILARVRTGRSAIMGAPVLDLLAFY
ncbi:MAG: hypothetical protein P8Y21_13285 [Gemmatimonadales bacterium]